MFKKLGNKSNSTSDIKCEVKLDTIRGMIRMSVSLACTHSFQPTIIACSCPPKSCLMLRVLIRIIDNTSWHIKHIAMNKPYSFVCIMKDMHLWQSDVSLTSIILTMKLFEYWLLKKTESFSAPRPEFVRFGVRETFDGPPRFNVRFRRHNTNMALKEDNFQSVSWKIIYKAHLKKNMASFSPIFVLSSLELSATVQLNLKRNCRWAETMEWGQSWISLKISNML